MSSTVHVAVLRWPEEAELRAALRARQVPRLLLVNQGTEPPTDTDQLEDWASATADATELEARMTALELRAAQTSRGLPTIGDDDDVIRFGGRWVALGVVEASVARVLIEHLGEVVSRAAIEEAAWQGRVVRSNTTDRQLHRLRGHLREIGLELHTIRGKGYVLEIPE